MENLIRHKFCEALVTYCESIEFLVYLDEFALASYIGYDYEDLFRIDRSGNIDLYDAHGLTMMGLKLCDPNALSLCKKHLLDFKSDQK